MGRILQVLDELHFPAWWGYGWSHGEGRGLLRRRRRRFTKIFVNKFDQLVFLGGLMCFLLIHHGESWPFVSKNLPPHVVQARDMDKLITTGLKQFASQLFRIESNLCLKQVPFANSYFLSSKISQISFPRNWQKLLEIIEHWSQPSSLNLALINSVGSLNPNSWNSKQKSQIFNELCWLLKKPWLKLQVLMFLVCISKGSFYLKILRIDMSNERVVLLILEP